MFLFQRALCNPEISLHHLAFLHMFASINVCLWVLFLPPSDVYVRSFLYLLYTLIKLYYTKALSDLSSSLALDWILLLWRPRTPASLHDSATAFHLGVSSGILQDKMGANNSSLTPFNYILKNWDRFDPQGLKKIHLVFLCDTTWLCYPLEDSEWWPVGGSLCFTIRPVLKKKKKKNKENG